MFKNAKWIWNNLTFKKDEHVEFFSRFEKKANGKKTFLCVSADSDYAVYLNGQMVYHGQYPDYPYYKVYDKIEIDKFIVDGENSLAIEVWYYGNYGTQTYHPGQAGLIFSVIEEDAILLESDCNVLSRISKTYLNYREKYITRQIGYTYAYDATKEDDWKICGASDFTKSSEFNRNVTLNERPIKRLITENGKAGKLIKIQTGRYLFDFKEEYTGDFRIDFEANKEKQLLHICWGEHIVDGWVRDKIEERDFSIDYYAKKGHNDFYAHFRRLGVRYLEIRTDEDIANLSVYIYNRKYPVNEIKFFSKDESIQKIYDACVNTLKLCMHEHYEDCPWREQALYTMDSRNQMLCGYYAFGEYDFPKACLRLISKEKREDSLLSICFPAGTELTIPSFGFHFFTEVYEYYKYSNDLSFIKELFPRMQSLINAYISYVNLDGLLYTFEGDLYWNFYEWADGLEGCLGKTENKRVDLILNCLFSIALSKMSYFCNLLNFENDYFDMANKTNEKIKAMFYNKSKKAFSMYADVELFSELGNSLAVLCGAANEDISNELCDKLVEETRWTPITLSMKCFKYDALLKINKDKYKDYIISDIKKVYQPMIENGNTVWETIKGQSDFNNAGSLCHGWSALPVYYFNILK